MQDDLSDFEPALEWALWTWFYFFFDSSDFGQVLWT